MGENQTPDADSNKEGAGNEENQADALELSLLSEKAGREFKNSEDFLKHYENLKSFAGKVNQDTPKNQDSPGQGDSAILEKMLSLEKKVSERDFLLDNPKAKDHLNLLRKVAQADGVGLEEAWKDEQVQELVKSHEAYQKETGVGVKSKNRINPLQSESNKDLITKARQGDEEARLKLMEMI